MTRDEALRMAIEAIENADYHNDLQAIAVIKEIMAQPEQKPVGKFAKFTDGIWREVTDGSAGVPLYTTPPQTEEKLITAVDIEKIVKFKERNT
jgi:hypothetical protein